MKYCLTQGKHKAASTHTEVQDGIEVSHARWDYVPTTSNHMLFQISHDQKKGVVCIIGNILYIFASAFPIVEHDRNAQRENSYLKLELKQA